MKPKIKKPLKNQLARFRQEKSLEQKQVAVLLGHKGPQHISRYENGVRIPSLRTALKLAQIYGIPIQILLEGYFKACRDEIKRQEGRLSLPIGTDVLTNSENIGITEFCTIEEKLRERKPERINIDKARRHSTDLIRTCAEKLNHI